MRLAPPLLARFLKNSIFGGNVGTNRGVDHDIVTLGEFDQVFQGRFLLKVGDAHGGAPTFVVSI